MNEYLNESKIIETTENNLKASQVRLFTEYRKLCQQIQKEKQCWESTEHCYSCEIHFNMNPLISKLKLYGFEVRDI